MSCQSPQILGTLLHTCLLVASLWYTVKAMERHLLFLYILKSFFWKILTIYLEIVFVVPILRNLSLLFQNFCDFCCVFHSHGTTLYSLVLPQILSLKYSIARGSIGKIMKTRIREESHVKTALIIVIMGFAVVNTHSASLCGDVYRALNS